MNKKYPGRNLHIKLIMGHNLHFTATIINMQCVSYLKVPSKRALRRTGNYEARKYTQ